MAALLDRPGIWLRAGMAGMVSGLAMGEALATLPDSLDRDFAIRLLGAAETGMVSRLSELHSAETGEKGEQP